MPYNALGVNLNGHSIAEINAYIAQLGDPDATDSKAELDAIAAELGVTILDTDGDGTYDAFDDDKDGDGVSNTDEDAAGSDPLDPNSIAFKGLVYNVITSPYGDHRQWLDRNQGATMVCSKSRDDTDAPYANDAAYVADQKNCFGGYFQWGRKYNGHEAMDSDTSFDMIAEDTETNGEFIVGHDQWSTVTDDVLWSGVDAINNVCPTGFRVPTIEEIYNDTKGVSGEDNVSNRDKAFKSFLKLPSSGFRIETDGSIAMAGDFGVLHGSTIDDEGDVSYFYAGSSGAVIDYISKRASAISVRCIKDTNISDTTAPTAKVSTPVTGAHVDRNITVFFSEPMDRSMLIAANFSLIKDPDGTPVAADVTLTETGVRVILDPAAELFYGTDYKLQISNVKDVAGNEMAPYEYSFATTDGSFTFRGKEYKKVTSPYTRKVWLDRNSGAEQACTVFDDADCYGDYYQWGRNADGHENSGSDTVATQATQIDPVQAEVDGKFITADDANDYDWAQAVDSNGSIRQTNWSKTDGTSVCPVGFRVPTIGELAAEVGDVIDRDTAFANFLKLPSADVRVGSSGDMGGVDSLGHMWTSSPHGKDSDILYFTEDRKGIAQADRVSGRSVRCLRD